MIYGDQLSFFPEQFRMFNYYRMMPMPKSSYTKRENLGKIKGIFQYAKRGELLRENDTLADVNVPTIWTRKKLEVGNYFINFNDEDFRIVNPADWSFEGGFYCYILETVVGNTDRQESFDYVDLGQNSYD